MNLNQVIFNAGVNAGLRQLQAFFIALCMVFGVVGAHADNHDSWTVNLKEADIRAFVTQVSDITGKSFVVDPRVKGKVTVVTVGF